MENERKDKWIQLVAVRFDPDAHDAYLYRAPRFRCNVGETVQVSFGGLLRYGKVIMEDSICVSEPRNYRHVRDIAKGFRAGWPLLPVLKVVTEYDVKFDEDDWKEADDDALRAE